MSGNIAETLGNLVHQTAFFNLTWGNYLMIAVACVFLYLAIKKGILSVTAGTDRVWYASGKYLSGYHDFSGKCKQRCRRFVALLLQTG